MTSAALEAALDALDSALSAKEAAHVGLSLALRDLPGNEPALAMAGRLFERSELADRAAENVIQVLRARLLAVGESA